MVLCDGRRGRRRKRALLYVAGRSAREGDLGLALPILPGEGRHGRDGRPPLEDRVEHGEVDELAGAPGRDRGAHEGELRTEKTLARRLIDAAGDGEDVLPIGEREALGGVVLALEDDLRCRDRERKLG
jgi:hypothetical protein